MKLAEDLRRAVLQAAIEGSLTGGSRDNWRFVRLGEIGEIIGGGTPNTSKSENWVNGRIAWITPADMGTLKSKYISHGARHITEKGLASSSARIMPKGSIIFSSRAPIGYIAIAENDLCTNQGCKSVKLYDGVLSEYVYFALLAMRDDIKKMGSGTTFKEISGRVFSSVIIPLPSIDEQRRIVSRLDAILPKIAELESAENELEALERRFPGDMRDSLLHAAIEGRLTGSNIDNWRFVRLGDVISLISGADLPSDQHNAVGNGTPYITGASNIVNGSLIINRWTTTPKKIAKRGDILLTCKGTIGANCILELEEAHIARQVMAIRVIGADTKFVHYYIQHYVDTLKQQAKSMIPGIERKNIIEAPISLPPINEQRRIVSRLNELLPLCEALETIIQGHKEMRISWNISSKRFA